ncbi:MAG: LysR family transcriptional regulator [Lysobacterales bacterium]|nr:LysR family transcriptional regulator [Xanthomonadales bacterium]MCP5477004.1 LysR family transcriptional regulator [Rhodanobacteraceae bacterium]
MTDLNALLVFARVAEAKSFSEAARRLNMPISTVSRKVADLEDALGVRLLERSTRRLRLTDIGEEILVEAQRGVELDEAVDSIVSNQLSEVRGLLRLSAPPSIGDSLLAPIITAFQSSYPGVRVHVLVTDRFVDHISEGIDLAFRVGKLKDSSLVAKTLLSYRRQLVASPEYLSRNPPPKKPGELGRHRLLAFSFSSDERSWSFSRGKRKETVKYLPLLAMNDYAGLAEALLSGSGIGDLPPIVRPELLRAGRLVEVMPDWRLAPETLSMIHLSNRHIPKVLRLFKEFAVQMAPAIFPDLPV